MNTIQQDTQNSFLQTCSNAYKTIEDQFQNLLNENKTSTLENLSTKLSTEFKINTIFPKDKLNDVREDLPIINGVQSFEELAKLDGQIVRYFCYVQDLLEPEMQIGALLKRDVANSTTVEEYLKEHKIKYLNYRDFYDPALFEEFDMNEDVVLFDRNNILATPIPYQNEWFSSLFQSTRTKTSPENKEYSSINSHLKAFFNSKIAPKGYADEDLNLGPFCLVKIYDSLDGKVALNQVIEVTGILQYQIENLKDANNAATLDEGDTFISTDALYPASLFPRLHAVDFKQLKTSDLISQKIVTKSLEKTEQLDFTQVRDEILDLLTVLTGDKKSSELLLVSLVSRIYMRKDLETLGKFTVNFIHADQPVKVLGEDGKEVKQQSVADLILAVIRRLLPFSVRLDIDIKSLNNIVLQPKKDHNLNCLSRGKLQMANDTLLVLDETHLDVGTLGEKAVRNLQVLNNLIQNQTLMYDFVYYESPLNTDIKSLILSKSKSILTADIQKNLPECERTLKEGDALCDVLFNDDNAKWALYRRYFLECFKKVEGIEITKEIAKVIEGDYVTECKGNNKMKAELLNQRLTIARYLAALEGRSEFDFILYNRAKEHDI